LSDAIGASNKNLDKIWPLLSGAGKLDPGIPFGLDSMNINRHYFQNKSTVDF
jgi:hypothetical protein